MREFKSLKEGIVGHKIMGELCGVLSYFADKYINSEIGRYTPE